VVCELLLWHVLYWTSPTNCRRFLSFTPLTHAAMLVGFALEIYPSSVHVWAPRERALSRPAVSYIFSVGLVLWLSSASPFVMKAAIRRSATYGLALRPAVAKRLTRFIDRKVIPALGIYNFFWSFFVGVSWACTLDFETNNDSRRLRVVLAQIYVAMAGGVQTGCFFFPRNLLCPVAYLQSTACASRGNPARIRLAA
jgi:hypothetical protein